MRTGEHEWPEEFRDEDRWLFFTKRQWLVAGTGLLPGILLTAFFVSAGLSVLLPIAFTVGAVCLIVALVVAVMAIPSSFYIYGSGMWVEQILLRLILKNQKKNKVIYSENHDNDYREEE